MRPGNAKKVLEHLATNPGMTRGELMRALNLRERQANNALWRLKDIGEIRCEFAGRFSRWSVAKPQARNGVATVANSVFALGACRHA
jgi:predicted HTH transcriptional regulator